MGVIISRSINEADPGLVDQQPVFSTIFNPNNPMKTHGVFLKTSGTYLLLLKS